MIVNRLEALDGFAATPQQPDYISIFSEMSDSQLQGGVRTEALSEAARVSYERELDFKKQCLRMSDEEFIAARNANCIDSSKIPWEKEYTRRFATGQSRVKVVTRLTLSDLVLQKEANGWVHMQKPDRAAVV